PCGTGLGGAARAQPRLPRRFRPNERAHGLPHRTLLPRQCLRSQRCASPLPNLLNPPSLRQESTMSRVYNTLFICTANSARSILAEGLLNGMGQETFRGYSAGSQPKGQVHPLALATLERLGMPIDGYRSKSWDEFVRPDAPQFDFIFTVCDNAA